VASVACTKKSADQTSFSDSTQATSQASSHNASQDAQAAFSTVTIGTDSATYYVIGVLERAEKPLEIQGELTLSNGNLEGFYGYNHIGKELSLKGTAAADANGTLAVNLEERTNYERFGYSEDDKKGRSGGIRGTLNLREGILRGTWSSPDGKTTFPCVLRFVARYTTLKDAKLQASVFYPQFAAAAYSAVNDSINRSMKTTYDSCLAEVKMMLKDNADVESLSGMKWEEVLTSTNDVSVVYAASNLLVLSHLVYINGGGAHGNYGYSSETWWKDANGSFKKIALKDLFTADTSYIKALSDILLAALKKREASFVINGDIDNLSDDIRRETFAWFVHPSCLRIVFSPYAVASYSEGAIEIRVPYVTLKRYLRKDGAAGAFLPPDSP
jgi:hypothetical protein